jgi:membrane-bound lytic murein transglycosylase A
VSVRFGGLALAAALLSACVSRQPPPPPAPPVARPLPPPPPAPVIRNALSEGVALSQVPAWGFDKAGAALAAFRTSCPVLMRRADQSGLTRASDWAPLCTEAQSIPAAAAASFFRDRFEWARVGEAKAFVTGYYEPEIAGSRVRAPGFEVPIHALPPDLVRCTRADGTTGRGRIAEDGSCVAYFTRAEVEDGALAGKGLEIAWAADPVEAFFLEIQGSGRIRLPDGSVMRVGYAGQNGHGYVAIGKLLRERGLLPPGGATAEGIKAWLRANPAAGKAVMRENASYVFFRELTGPGPLGALNVPVAGRTAAAADPLFVPLGAPVWLALDRKEANGLWVAQDTGGAIKGPNRFDSFWGAGDGAAALAGGMAANGTALILLPKGSVARAQARP